MAKLTENYKGNKRKCRGTTLISPGHKGKKSPSQMTLTPLTSKSTRVTTSTPVHGRAISESDLNDFLEKELAFYSHHGSEVDVIWNCNSPDTIRTIIRSQMRKGLLDNVSSCKLEAVNADSKAKDSRRNSRDRTKRRNIKAKLKQTDLDFIREILQDAANDLVTSPNGSPTITVAKDNIEKNCLLQTQLYSREASPKPLDSSNVLVDEVINLCNSPSNDDVITKDETKKLDCSDWSDEDLFSNTSFLIKATQGAVEALNLGSRESLDSGRGSDVSKQTESTISQHSSDINTIKPYPIATTSALTVSSQIDSLLCTNNNNDTLKTDSNFNYKISTLHRVTRSSDSVHSVQSKTSHHVRQLCKDPSFYSNVNGGQCGNSQLSTESSVLVKNLKNLSSIKEDDCQSIMPNNMHDNVSFMRHNSFGVVPSCVRNLNCHYRDKKDNSSFKRHRSDLTNETSMNNNWKCSKDDAFSQTKRVVNHSKDHVEESKSLLPNVKMSSNEKRSKINGEQNINNWPSEESFIEIGDSFDTSLSDDILCQAAEKRGDTPNRYKQNKSNFIAAGANSSSTGVPHQLRSNYSSRDSMRSDVKTDHRGSFMKETGVTNISKSSHKYNFRKSSVVNNSVTSDVSNVPQPPTSTNSLSVRNRIQPPSSSVKYVSIHNREDSSSRDRRTVSNFNIFIPQANINSHSSISASSQVCTVEEIESKKKLALKRLDMKRHSQTSLLR